MLYERLIKNNWRKKLNIKQIPAELVNVKQNK